MGGKVSGVVLFVPLRAVYSSVHYLINKLAIVADCLCRYLKRFSVGSREGDID